ncbi:hypothetical protein Vadar_017183 [Vaccinium darrowii]|uniref:Uncharacterized protein n=1 Tax=Vaccinium darrowii TaxID=229202 RepID=A0ACB7YM90_9ERIC|nr:hypothetical protein Vadar_017183 [Vaccinium darrowii]
MCTPQGILEKLACLAFDETVKDVVKRRKYVLNYSANLEELRSEMTRLEDHWTIIERKVRVANDRGEEVENLVLHWRTKVEDLRKEFQELTQKSIDHEKMRCFACSCPNIKWRYRLSKQAEEKIVHVRKLIEERHFDEISHARPLPLELQRRSNENYENFASRTQIFKDIVEALKDASVNVIGIHGLGGVGKTTLVEEVGEKMQQDETFKQVTLVAVSKDLNVKEIQLKLAESLNFRFDANVDDQKGRAAQLWHKFNNGKKYLVILDDLWEEVDIKAIGIPITDGKTGCKVVLTSRKEDLLVNKMKVDRHFFITELQELEAWTLFKKKVGDSIESQLELHSLALKVCEKCKGLPVVINAIGAALQGKQDHAWRNALSQLEKYMLTKIEDIDPSVWASLKVSYDMLRSSDAKSCFLLCCLFAEDAEIPLEDLTRYCVASGLLFQNPRTLEEAKDAICTIVDALKSASLLSIGSNENVVRIHDVIRDVGISIAREEKAMLVDSGALQWPRNPVNGPSYSVISLSSATINWLPGDLEYPQLHTLMFDNSELTDLEVPDNFFEGMKQLTVLILARMQMWRLPSSLAKLPNLRMLCLKQCKLAEMSILGDLKTNLDVLSFQGSTIKGLPPEIAKLTSLQLLDLRDCADLELIPQGIISKLTNLEELYFAETFDKWEATMSKSKNMSLDEIRSLLSTSRLTTLHIHIPAVTLLPKEDLMFENLKKFRISMGSNFEWDEDFPGSRVLKYEGSSLRKEFIPLVDKAEALYLGGINDMNGLHPLQLFNKLSVLRIDNCKLKYLFSTTTARGLVHLEELQVKDCEIIEEIVGFEGQKVGNELIFSKLKILHLEGLPNLTSFYAEKEKTRTTKGSSSTRHQSLFNEKVIFPVLEELEVEELDSIEEIWDKQSPSVNEKTASFSQLTDVTVKKCEKLMNLGPWNILSRLRNLQRLTVYGCPNVEFIVLFKNGKGEEEVADDSTLIIPLLRHLRIEKMEKLKSFYSSSTTANAQSLFNHQVILPSLEVLKVQALDSIKEIWDKQSTSVIENTASFSQLRDMTVEECKELVNLGPANILPRLRNLQSLIVSSCPNVEVIVLFKNGKEEEAADESTFIIPQLRYLAIWNMEKLKSFCSSSTTSNAQSLFNHQV